MSGSREKLRAVVLAFVMVTSVMVGTVALSGTAAAGNVSLGAGNVETLDQGDAVGSAIGTNGDTSDDSSASANNGQIDQIVVDFNQPVDDDQTDLSGITVSGFTIDRVTTNGLDADSSNDDEITIELEESGSPDTGNTPQVTFAAGTIEEQGTSDPNSRIVITPTDSAAPVLTSAQTSSVDSNGNVDEISTTFSESLPDAQNIPTSGFSLSVGSVSGFQGDSSSNPADDDDADILLDVTNIQGATATPQVTAVGGNSFTDGTNAQSADTSVTASNGVSSTLNGDSNSEIATDIGSDNNGFDRVLAGNATEDLGLIKIRDVSGGDSPLAAETALSMPSGITINESASDFTITTTSGNLGVTSSSVEDGGSTLVLDHGSTSSDGGQTIRIQGMSVDVAPDAAASQAGVREPDNDITVSYAIGELDTSLLEVQKAGVSFVNDNSPGTFGAGTTENSLDSDIQIDAPANLDGGIAGGSDIVINANESNGITFNTDTNFDPTVLDARGAQSGKVDTSEATLSSTQLVIPVTNEFSAGDTVRFDTDGTDDNALPIDVSGDAQASQLSATFRTNQSTGDLTALTSSDTADQISVNRPVLDLGDGDETTSDDTASTEVDRADSLAVGKNGQETTSSQSGVLALELTSDGQLSDGSDVVITTNRSDVTFDTSASITNDGDNTLDASGPEVEITNGQDNSEAVSGTSINEDSIVITVNDGSDGFEDGDIIALDELPLNVGSSVPEDARVSFNATTEPSTGTTVLSSEADNDFVGLERPDIDLNDDSNITFDLDADGGALGVDPDTGSAGADSPSENALTITTDDADNMIAADTRVTISLESNTGVTFNQSQSLDLSGGLDNDLSDNNNVPEPGDTVDVDSDLDGSLSSGTYTANEISFDVGNTASDPGEDIVLDQLYLNVSSGAQNANLSVTTDTGDNSVTTIDNKIVEINSVTPDNVFADANINEDSADGDVGPDLDGTANGDFGTVNDEEATDDGTTDDKPTVDETITSRVFVEDGNNNVFGGADVNFEVVQTPDGSSGASLNTTTALTGSNGVAAFDFTVGDTDGIYVVNASTATGSVNVTYDAQPGEATSVSVSPIENAISNGDNEIGQAALFVNATDANGNPVAQSPTVTLTVDNVGSNQISEFPNKDADGARDSLTGGETGDAGDGQFDIDGDGSSIIELRSGNTAQDVTIEVTLNGESDSGTVTFFNSVGAVDLSLNESTVAPDDRVAANATLSERQADGGEIIEVPDITVDFDDNGNGNTTFNGGPDASAVDTTNNGVASATVTAEQPGSSTIDAVENLKSDSATITVEEAAEDAPANFSVSDLEPQDATVNVSEAFDVSATVENTGDLQGEQEIELLTEPEGGSVLNNTTISLDPGANTTVTFENVTVDTAGEFNHTVASANDSVSGNLTVEEAAEDAPANFSVSDLEPQDATVNVSEAFDVSATVENTGDLQGEQEIELLTEPEGGSVLNNTTISLDPGANTTVTFENVTVDTAGEFNHTVASANDSVSGNLTVEEAAEDAPANFSVSDLEPQDATVNVSEAFDVSATVENTGDLQGEQEIELLTEPEGGSVLNNTTISLDPGANTTVTFENVTVDTAGEFNHTVASANDSVSGNLTVEEAAQNVTVGGQEVPVRFTTETEDGDRTVTADNAVNAINTFLEDGISADVAVDVINAFLES